MAAPAPHRAREPSERLRDSIVRLDARRRRWAGEAGRTLMTAVAVIGIGWLVVVPAVAGFALGHWLDGRLRTGVVFSAGLGLLGIALGCWSAWRRVSAERDRGEHP